VSGNVTQPRVRGAEHGQGPGVGLAVPIQRLQGVDGGPWLIQLHLHCGQQLPPTGIVGRLCHVAGKGGVGLLQLAHAQVHLAGEQEARGVVGGHPEHLSQSHLSGFEIFALPRLDGPEQEVGGRLDLGALELGKYLGGRVGLLLGQKRLGQTQPCLHGSRRQLQYAAEGCLCGGRFSGGDLQPALQQPGLILRLHGCQGGVEVAACAVEVVRRQVGASEPTQRGRVVRLGLQRGAIGGPGVVDPVEAQQRVPLEHLPRCAVRAVGADEFQGCLVLTGQDVCPRQIQRQGLVGVAQSAGALELLGGRRPVARRQLQAPQVCSRLRVVGLQLECRLQLDDRRSAVVRGEELDGTLDVVGRLSRVVGAPGKQGDGGRQQRRGLEGGREARGRVHGAHPLGQPGGFS
jgi:hypothetical protein